VTIFDADHTPVSQDGPGWWAARAAIERAAALEKSPRTSFMRTCFNGSPHNNTEVACDAATDAFLLCRDAMVGQMTERQRQLLLGVMLGHSQAELAKQQGITQSAVSQTLSRSGGTAIELAHLRLAVSLPR
jgi:DNA-directed RNA polymerase specialized sigma24 family protein